jgi:N12 class adenine-specific DNA methylase
MEENELPSTHDQSSDRIVAQPVSNGRPTGMIPAQLDIFAAVAEATTSIPATNFRLLGDRRLAPTWRQRAADNLAAIKLTKQLLEDGRPATEAEQARLIRFVGFGATDLSKLFGRGPLPTGFDPIAKQMDRLLTAEERASLATATQYAHFTPENIVRAMWKAVRQLGFTGGAIVEPGCGVGIFNALMPEGIMMKSSFLGIERDPITARIAKLLYPESDIWEQDFSRAILPPDFDLAIGNPPFSPNKIKVNDPAGKLGVSLHNYFIARAIERLRPGGLAAFVVTHYFMDAGASETRKFIADKADLLGAIRLPEASMRADAGTDVVVDLVFFQRRDDANQASDYRWVDVGGCNITDHEGQPHPFNPYWASNPGMVLGEHAITSSQFGPTYTCKPGKVPLDILLSGAIGNLPSRIYEPANGALGGRHIEEKRGPIVQVGTAADGSRTKEGSYIVQGGVLYQIVDGRPAVVEIKAGKGSPGIFPKHAGIIRDMIPIREAVRDVLRAQEADQPWDEAQARLNAAYDAFCDRHGPINTTIISERLDPSTMEVKEYYRYPNLSPFRDDPDSALLSSIEYYDTDSGAARKGPIFDQRVISPPPQVSITGPADALAVTLNEHGRVEMVRVADLLGKSEQEAADALGATVYLNPTTKCWDTADAYLSGLVRDKLAQARDAAVIESRFDRNVAALEAVQPVDLLPSDISARLGASWIPVDVVKAFSAEVIGIRAAIYHTPEVGSWSVDLNAFDGKAAATTDWGTNRRHAGHLLLDALTSTIPQIWDNIKDEMGRETRILNVKETQAAKDKLEKIKEAFAEWVWKNPARSDKLAAIYNQHYNNLVPRKFNGDHMLLPGASDSITLRIHQKRAAWRMVCAGSTYLAHVVGSGKTLALIAGVMEQRRLGLISKPMIVVPSHTLNQWSHEFLSFYPNASILVADESNFEKDKRSRFVARAATGLWDAVIITHSAFKFLSVPHEFEIKLINEQLATYDEVLSNVDANDRNSVKKIERLKEGLKLRLEALIAIKDDMLTLPEMGVDQIIVDECFPYDTKITTDKGPMKIGDIVEKRLPVRVLSFNNSTKRTEWKPIVRWLLRGEATELVRIVHEHGEFVCTPNHPIFTYGGTYIQAGALVPGSQLLSLSNSVHADSGDTKVLLCGMQGNREVSDINLDLLFLPKAIPPAFVECEKESANMLQGVWLRSQKVGDAATPCGETLRAVRSSVRDTKSNSFAYSKAQVLFECVSNHMEKQPARSARGIYRQDFPDLGSRKGQKESCCLSGNESQQPDAQCCVSCENDKIFEGTHLSFQGREGEADRATNSTRYGIGPSHGACDQNGAGNGSISKPAAPLYGGHSQSNFEGSNRSGRTVSQHSEVEVSGSAKDRGVVCSRVVSVEVLEPGGAHWPIGLHSHGSNLYDIEVEDNHNFFADGVLAHNCQQFRKLHFATNMSSLKGVDAEGSQRAWDLYVKTKFLDERRPGRALHMASGTPITNTMGEMFSLQRFMNEFALTSRNIQFFDAWASTFCDTKTELELQASGSYKAVTRLSQFLNIPELITMFLNDADVVLSDDLGQYVQLPTIRGGKRQIMTYDAGPAFKMAQKLLAARMSIIEHRDGKPSKGDDIILTVIGDGRLDAIDLRLGGLMNSVAVINRTGDWDDRALLDRHEIRGAGHENNPNSKLNGLIDKVIEIWRETSDNLYRNPSTGDFYPTPGAAQMVFSDIGVSGSRGFSAYDWMVRRLVSAGIPREQIAVMQDYKKMQAKQRLFNSVNSGQVRILIGSSETMGTGVNVQQRLIALHHLDAPWLPSLIEQREGRIRRQGNQNPEIQIYAYATLGSFDATMWQILERKMRFIDAILSGDRSIRTLEDLDESQADQFAMAKAMASGDDRLKRKAGLETDIARLQRKRAAHYDSQSAVRREIRWSNERIERAKTALEHIEADIQARCIPEKDAFTMTVEGVVYTDRKEAGAAIMQSLSNAEMEGKDRDWIIAEYAGFRLEAQGWQVVDKKHPYRLIIVVRRSGSTNRVFEQDLRSGEAIIIRCDGVLTEFERQQADELYTIKSNEATVADYSKRESNAPFELQAELDHLMNEWQAVVESLSDKDEEEAETEQQAA